jgi:hypothetical protein
MIALPLILIMKYVVLVSSERSQEKHEKPKSALSHHKTLFVKANSYRSNVHENT